MLGTEEGHQGRKKESEGDLKPPFYEDSHGTHRSFLCLLARKCVQGRGRTGGKPTVPAFLCPHGFNLISQTVGSKSGHRREAGEVFENGCDLNKASKCPPFEQIF